MTDWKALGFNHCIVPGCVTPGISAFAYGFCPWTEFARIYANSVQGQNPYAKADIPGVTQPGTIQWLNPSAFQSVIDTSVAPRTCFPTTNVQNCQDGSLGR